MTTQPNPRNLKTVVDTLKAALNPERQVARDRETISESQLHLVRNLRRRTGVVTVVEGEMETPAICLIEEREHGVFMFHGLPDGWWLLYSKDVPVEWDGDVDAPLSQPAAEVSAKHIARPLPKKAGEDGPTHVLDTMHRSIQADDFFSGPGRHNWFAKRFDPSLEESEADVPSLAS